MQDFPKGFLSRLNECRNNLSVSAFSRFIGLNQKTVDLYVKGERKPSVELIIAVCSKCGVSADWLLGLSDERAIGVSITAGDGSAVAANRSTATVNSAPAASSSDTARLIGIIESQQAVIAKLSGVSQLPGANHPVITEGETGISKAGPPTVNDTKSWRPKGW